MKSLTEKTLKNNKKIFLVQTNKNKHIRHYKFYRALC